MQLSDDNRARPLRAKLIAAAVVAAAVVACLTWSYVQERLQLAAQNAFEIQNKCDAALGGVTRIRVWAAGMRQAKDDRFCPCPAIRPQVINESEDAAEVREVVSAFVCRPYNGLGPHVAACSALTIELCRGEELALSMNYRGSDSFCSRWSNDSRSSWWLPFTELGQKKLDAWIEQHGLLKRVEAAYSSRK